MIGIDWRGIWLFVAGWGIGAFFWIPLTILLMRVMVSMDVEHPLRKRMVKLLKLGGK